MKVQTTKAEIAETLSLIQLREQLETIQRFMVGGREVAGSVEMRGYEETFVVDFDAKKSVSNTLEMQANKKIAELWAKEIPSLIERSLEIIDGLNPFEIVKVGE